jgi:hypothetical protein
MISDLLAVLAGFCLFSLVAFLPGYAAGWVTNVLRFRARTPAFRFAASVPLSIAMGPILSFTIGNWFSLNVVLILYGCVGVFALALIARDLPRAPREALPFVALIAVWLSIALLSLIDLQYGGRTYFSTIAFDYAIRIPITEAISTFGLPARSPFFFPGHPVALRYHYFWMILCALVRKLGGNVVDARQTFIAGTLWSGIAVMCLVPLYLRLFSPQGRLNLYRRSFIGICLLGVTGLDILPALLMIQLHRIGIVQGMSPSVEWWNNQVDGWVYTMLWEPHYICALVACLTGFLVLWDIPRDSRIPYRITSGVMAGFAFASAVGAGIYVPLVFAAFLAIWTLVLASKRQFPAAATFVLSGVVAATSAIPFLRTLAASKGTGGSFLQLTFRSFELGEIFLRIFRLDRPWQLLTGDVVMLPLNYLLELGVFFLVGYLVCKNLWTRRKALSQCELAALLMAATSMVICTFVRSGVIANNDLGWRGFLICQFILLLWAADLLPHLKEFRPPAKVFIVLFIVLGAMGVVYDLAILRFYPVLSDSGTVPKIYWLADDQRLGERTTANREAYQWLRGRTTPQAIIQQNPDVFQENFYGLYGQRQTMAGGKVCLTTFGGDPLDCTPLLLRLAPLFAGGTSDRLDAACRALPADAFIAKDTDGAWRDKTSWVWRTSPAFQNSFVRIYFCHSSQVQSK